MSGGFAGLLALITAVIRVFQGDSGSGSEVGQGGAVTFWEVLLMVALKGVTRASFPFP